MSKKKLNSFGGLIYSTNPDFVFDNEQEQTELLPPDKQPLKIQLQTKHRAGKTVTIVFQFTGPDNDLQQLAKQLKNHCGTGGSAKDGEIIIQGDHRQKVLQWLQKNGYKLAKVI